MTGMQAYVASLPRYQMPIDNLREEMRKNKNMRSRALNMILGALTPHKDPPRPHTGHRPQLHRTNHSVGYVFLRCPTFRVENELEMVSVQINTYHTRHTNEYASYRKATPADILA